MAHPNAHDLFVDALPWMQRATNYRFRHLDGDRRQEAVQNTLTLAWKAFRRLDEEGRADIRLLNSVLRYSIQQTTAGRKIQGTNYKKAKDAIEYGKRGKVQFEPMPLDSFVGKSTPIPDAVSFRVDVPMFLASLTERQQAMAEELMFGKGTAEVAKKFGVTAGAVSQFRARFKQLYDEFFEDHADVCVAAS